MTTPYSRSLCACLLVLAAGCTPMAPAADVPAKPTAAAEGEAAAAPADSTAPPGLTRPPADAQRTASGLVTKVLKAGEGERRPTLHDAVRVHFTGWKASGKRMDSTLDDGRPATFELRGVIPGWTEGLQLMRVGERRRLWIPARLSYLRPGRPGGDVVFDIELLEIIEGDVRAAPADLRAPPATAKKTDSGLAYELLSPATTDDSPNPWDRVTLSYAAWTQDGEMLEASSKATFDVARVMPGWREALLRMSVGQRARLWVPPQLARRDSAGSPDGLRVYELELLAVERRPEPPRAPADVTAPPASATRTPSGLAYRMLASAKGGARPRADSRVALHYSGWSSDGTLIESTKLRGKPRTVPLRHVMAGWREGLQLLTEGDRALFWIPEELAHAGAPGAPAGMLVYELELLQVVR